MEIKSHQRKKKLHQGKIKGLIQLQIQQQLQGKTKVIIQRQLQGKIKKKVIIQRQLQGRRRIRILLRLLNLMGNLDVKNQRKLLTDLNL